MSIPFFVRFVIRLKGCHAHIAYSTFLFEIPPVLGSIFIVIFTIRISLQEMFYFKILIAVSIEALGTLSFRILTSVSFFYKLYGPLSEYRG